MVLARYGGFLVACSSLMSQVCPLQHCTPKHPYAKYPCLDARANARTCSLLCPLSFYFRPPGSSCPEAYFHGGKTHPLDGKSSQNPNYLTLFSDRHHHRHPNHCSAIIATLALVYSLAITAYHYSQPQLRPASPSLSPFCFRLARFLRSV